MVTQTMLFASAGTSPTLTTLNLTNCIALNLVSGNATEAVISVSTTGGTVIVLVLFITITKANASVQLGYTSTMSSPSNSDFYVCQLPNPIN